MSVPLAATAGQFAGPLRFVRAPDTPNHLRSSPEPPELAGFYVDSHCDASPVLFEEASSDLKSFIAAALLMASIEAQISAAFAADAPKTQFVRPTDADAWGG